MTSIVEALRREFDATFAAPRAELSGDDEVLLSIRVGNRPYALRVRELGGTAVGQRLTPVPSKNRTLLGLAAIRGAVVPVFDLAAVLGEAGAGKAVRWVALTAGQDPLAFAFSELEGHLNLARSELGPIEGPEERWASEVIRSEAGLRPVLKMRALVDAVSQPTVLERQGKGEVNG